MLVHLHRVGPAATHVQARVGRVQVLGRRRGGGGRPALGPLALGLLTSRVYVGYPEPMRYAGVTMCLVFLIGLATVPFAPETKGKPLPE